ncbi:hypothetical protein NMY22_g3339 [Coprinellus aureogranulatus]|nr:hypothetical protein NMY22_g3339 [Coprinellus aureogranulatus]
MYIRRRSSEGRIPTQNRFWLPSTGMSSEARRLSISLSHLTLYSDVDRVYLTLCVFIPPHRSALPSFPSHRSSYRILQSSLAFGPSGSTLRITIASLLSELAYQLLKSPHLGPSLFYRSSRALYPVLRVDGRWCLVSTPSSKPGVLRRTFPVGSGD